MPRCGLCSARGRATKRKVTAIVYIAWTVNERCQSQERDMSHPRLVCDVCDGTGHEVDAGGCPSDCHLCEGSGFLDDFDEDEE